MFYRLPGHENDITRCTLPLNEKEKGGVGEWKIKDSHNRRTGRKRKERKRKPERKKEGNLEILRRNFIQGVCPAKRILRGVAILLYV